LEFGEEDELVFGGEDEQLEEYIEVIDCALFQQFEDKFSPAVSNPYQLVFNRCIYDALNIILDDFRPFGSRGMPGICIKSVHFPEPTLEDLLSRLLSKLREVATIKMGFLNQQKLTDFHRNEACNRGLKLWTADTIRELEREFNYSEEDDTIELYELMLDVEEMLFE
jgi:hypothetical protein